MWVTLKSIAALVLCALIVGCFYGVYAAPDLFGPLTVMAVSFGTLLGCVFL